MKGKVYQINIKDKTDTERGLPKFPVQSAQVSSIGVEGDFNRYRQEIDHGNPDMAILVMPLETIRQLNQEGWPINPGDLGENITSEGMEYRSFYVGGAYKIGNEVEIQISKPCDPCNNVYLLPYVGVEKGPSFMKALVGRRGWYARVLKDGKIRTGDSIEAIHR